MTAPDPELTAAMQDATKRGVGWLRILRITTEQYRLVRVDPSLVVVLDNPTAYLDKVRALIYAIPCATCEAAPDESCRTTSGRPTTFHVARSQPVIAAWRLGHVDGLVDGLRRLLNDWETPAEELLSKNAASWS